MYIVVTLEVVVLLLLGLVGAGFYAKYRIKRVMKNGVKGLFKRGNK